MARDDNSPAPTWETLQEPQDASGDSEGEDELNHGYDPPENRPKLPARGSSNFMKRNRENEGFATTSRPQKRPRPGLEREGDAGSSRNGRIASGTLNRGPFSAGPSRLREQFGLPSTIREPGPSLQSLGRSVAGKSLPGSSTKGSSESVPSMPPTFSRSKGSINAPRQSLPSLPSQAQARSGFKANFTNIRKKATSPIVPDSENEEEEDSSSKPGPSSSEPDLPRQPLQTARKSTGSSKPPKKTSTGPRPGDDIIVLSSDSDEEVPSPPSRPQVRPLQVGRKSTGSGKPPRANAVASSSKPGQPSGSSVFNSPKKSTWMDFAENISAGYPKAGSRSTSPSKRPSSSKMPNSTLDNFVIKTGKISSKRSSEPSTGDESVDRRHLEEALGIEESISARRPSTPTPKGKKVIKEQVVTPTVPKASGSRSKNFISTADLASTIQAAGEQNSRSAARLRNPKSAAPRTAPSLPAESSTLGASIDSAIDLTSLLSTDEEDEGQSAPPPRSTPHPRRKLSRASLPQPSSATAANNTDSSDIEIGPVSGRRPASSKSPSRSAIPDLPTDRHQTAIKPRKMVARKTVSSPARPPGAPKSPVRRYTLPTAATEATVNEAINVPRVTRIPTPAFQRAPSLSPPASVISINSSHPSRVASPRPTVPIPQLPFRPPVSRSNTTPNIPITATIAEPTNVEAVPLDRLFDDDVDVEEAATSTSDADAAMEVDALLSPSTRGASSELDGLTEALGSQKLKTASPSDEDDTIASREASPPRPQPRQPSPAFSDDFYASDEADNEDNVSRPPEMIPPRESSASVSSADSETCHTPADLPIVPAPSLPGVKSYGGIQAITFDNWRPQFNPKVWYTKDLPNSLHDQINACSDRFRMCQDMRQVLAAEMSFNTIEDEPNAPPILIVNNVDQEPTPQWEFHYTNRIYHGPGVPDPDIANLVGCDCVGKCDPKSKTCACVKRQRKLIMFPEDNMEVYNSGFLYDKQKRLKHAPYPIVECNALCGCDAECMNRVVQHGRTVAVTIQKTEKKGWGVFAGSKKIPSGTFLGIYSGELLNNEESEERGKYYNSFGKTYLFDLDFYFMPNKDEDGDVIVQYTMDAYHAGNFTRFLNHSCEPNCRILGCYINEANLGKPLLVIFAIRDIEPNEEICFSYVGDDEEDLVPEEAKKDGAVYKACMCGAPSCSGKMFK